jgi:hypothetical protein
LGEIERNTSGKRAGGRFDLMRWVIDCAKDGALCIGQVSTVRVRCCERALRRLCVSLHRRCRFNRGNGARRIAGSQREQGLLN